MMTIEMRKTRNNRRTHGVSANWHGVKKLRSALRGVRAYGRHIAIKIPICAVRGIREDVWGVICNGVVYGINDELSTLMLGCGVGCAV